MDFQQYIDMIMQMMSGMGNASPEERAMLLQRLQQEGQDFRTQGQRASPPQPTSAAGFPTGYDQATGRTQGVPADLPPQVLAMMERIGGGLAGAGNALTQAVFPPGRGGAPGGEYGTRMDELRGMGQQAAAGGGGGGVGPPNYGLPGTAADPNNPIDPHFARNLPELQPGQNGYNALRGGGGAGYGAPMDAHERRGGAGPMGFPTPPSAGGGGGPFTGPGPGGGPLGPGGPMGPGMPPGGGGMGGGGGGGPMGGVPGGGGAPDLGRTPFMRTYYDKMAGEGQGADVLDSMYRDRGLNRPDRDPIADLNKRLYGRSLGLIASGVQTADQANMPDSYEVGNRLTGAMGRMGGQQDLNAYRQQILEGFTPGGDEALDNLYASQGDEALLDLMLTSELMGGSLPGLAKSRADLANQDMIRAQRAYLEANQGAPGKMSDFDRMSIYRNRMSR